MNNRIKVLISAITVLSLFSLSACMKSEEVKEVEELIDAIGDVSLESGDAIADAEKAYKKLSSSDADKVSNYFDLDDARDEYDDLVEEAVEDVNELYTQLNRDLANRDLDAANATLEEIEELYDLLPSDEQEELDFDVDEISTLLGQVCYPGTEIWKLELVVGTTGMTGITTNDVAPAYTSQCWYSYGSGSEATAAANAYIDYLDETSGITYQSTDSDLNLVTYSYGNGKHIEIFVMNFGGDGGEVSVGFY